MYNSIIKANSDIYIALHIVCIVLSILLVFFQDKILELKIFKKYLRVVEKKKKKNKKTKKFFFIYYDVANPIHIPKS